MVQISTVETPVFNRAVSAYEAGKLVDAEQLCQQVVAARPQFSDAIHLLGLIQSSLGKIDAALANYDRAIELRPGFAMAHYNRGILLEKIDRHHEALASYDRAIALRPDFAAALCNRGNLLLHLRQLAEALESYDRAVALRPNFAMAHYNRGRVLQDLNRQGEALASYDRALAARPQFAEALSNRGNVLLELTRLTEAVASYDRAVEIRPDFAEALSNRGSALEKLARYEEAVASFDRAVALRPAYSGAFSNRGIVLRQLQRFDEALADFASAIAASPSNAEAHFGEAEVRLLRADFDRGWREYEWRSRAQQLRHSQRNFARPLWLGQNDIAGKTILLHAEQGLGDTIQFCRYVPLVAQRGARVVLEVQDSLKELMSSLAGATEVVASDAVLPEFDLQCPLLSLPLAFATRLETIPSAVPYLQASSSAVAKWNTRLGPNRRLRVGLAWSGRPMPRHRSIPLGSLLSLLDMDATFVSLQKDVKPEDASILSERSDLLHFGDDLQDFTETAALIANMDLVISIDTSVAHLAGALAKPIWVMLPFTPDWRWLLDRDDSPWYPTARLFRQSETRSWEGVIARVREVLTAQISATRGDVVRSGKSAGKE